MPFKLHGALNELLVALARRFLPQIYRFFFRAPLHSTLNCAQRTLLFLPSLALYSDPCHHRWHSCKQQTTISRHDYHRQSFSPVYLRVNFIYPHHREITSFSGSAPAIVLTPPDCELTNDSHTSNMLLLFQTISSEL